MVVRELLTKWGFDVDDGPLRALDGAVHNLKVGVAAVLGAATAAAGSLLGLAASTAKAGDESREMAQRVGLNVELLQELAFAAKLGGVEAGELEGALRFLNRNMDEARTKGGAAAEAFQRAGVSLRDAQGKARSADQVLLLLSERFKDMPDGAKKSALAMEIFGRSGTAMIPVLNQGAKGIAAAGQRARDYGVVLTAEATAAGDQFADSLVEMDAALTGVRNTVGVALMPVVQGVVQDFTAWVAANRGLIAQKASEWAQRLAGFVRAVWDAVTGAVQVVRDLVDALGGFKGVVETARPLVQALLAVLAVQTIFGIVGAFRALRASIAAVNATLLANPITAIVALFAVAVALIIANWDEIRDAGRMAWIAIQEAWGALAGWFRGLWEEAIGVVQDAIGWMEARFNEFAGFFGGIADAILGAFRSAFDWILGKVDAVLGAARRIGSVLGLTDDSGAAPAGRPALTGGVSPATAPASAPAQRTVNVDAALTVQVPAGMSPAQAEDFLSRTRQVVRDELGTVAREAAGDLG